MRQMAQIILYGENTWVSDLTYCSRACDHAYSQWLLQYARNLQVRVSTRDYHAPYYEAGERWRKFITALKRLNLQPHQLTLILIMLHPFHKRDPVSATIQEGQEWMGHRIFAERAQTIFHLADWRPKDVFVRILRGHHTWGNGPPGWEETTQQRSSTCDQRDFTAQELEIERMIMNDDAYCADARGKSKAIHEPCSDLPDYKPDAKLQEFSKRQLFDLLDSVGGGQVVTLYLPRDQDRRRPLGHGFVEYPDADTATVAVRDLNGREIMGRKLRVEFDSMEEVRGSNGYSAEPRVRLPPPSTHHPSILKVPQGSPQSIALRGPSPVSSSIPGRLSMPPRSRGLSSRASESQEKSFKCGCEKSFYTLAGLHRHRSDPRRANPEKCNLAGEQAQAAKTAKGNEVVTAGSQSMIFRCGCGQECATPIDLQRHQLANANSEKCIPRDAVGSEQAIKPDEAVQPCLKNIRCGCGRRFVTVRSVQQHQQNKPESAKCHTWENLDPEQNVEPSIFEGLKTTPKPFQCGCGRRFTMLMDIQYHRTTWSGFENVKCRERTATFMGRPYDPTQAGTTGQAVTGRLDPPESDTLSGQTQVHWTRRDTGRYLHKIVPSLVQPAKTPVTSKDGYQTLGSYNWSSAGPEGNMYFVPGAAPMWQHLTLPKQLTPDTDFPLVDSETAQDLPAYPYQASLEAIQIMNPGRTLNDVDLVTDWKALKILLNLTAGKQCQAFRMKLYLVKNTLIIEMRSELAEARRSGIDPVRRSSVARGYGRSLEPIFNKWDAGFELSEAHIRTVQYNLGSWICVVRFQADSAYTTSKKTRLPESGGKAPVITGPTMGRVGEDFAKGKNSAAEKLTSDQALASEEQTTRIVASGNKPPYNTPTGTSASGAATPQDTVMGKTTPDQAAPATTVSNVIIRGGGTPQEYMSEIKTKAHSAKASSATVPNSWMSQTWFTRVANLIVCQHDEGLVRYIKHHDLVAGSEWEMWEEQERNQLALRKLETLLSEMRNLVAEHAARIGGYGALFVVYDREDDAPELRVYESEEDRDAPLPEGLIKSLWSNGGERMNSA
ncbi:hypothetical protein VMCG_08095 [Cytospora schulzeri]|uniref:RRM domain-containing protein n=1 Tax=Cytospora schulzeri TaxID=448051 RepID=A0A423VRE5_9PEZI|nr:hypothetical protein VMCG_08095 [Valsa malicola]